MSSQSTNSSVDRDVQREKERQARARSLRGGRSTGPGGGNGGGSGGQGGGIEEMRESAPKPFFPQPIKVDPALEDETSRRIRNALGDFKEVQRYLVNDHKHLIGISSNPVSVTLGAAATASQQGQQQRKDTSHHDDHKKGMVNGQYKGSSGSMSGGAMVNHHRNNRNHHQTQPAKHPTQQSQNSSSGPSGVGSSNYQAQSGRRSGATAGKEAEPPPKSHRKKIPYPLSSSSSTHSNPMLNSSGNSSTVNLSSSSTPKDGRAPKMNNPTRPDSRRSDLGASVGQSNRLNSSRGSSANNSSYHNSHNGEIGSNQAQSSDNLVARLPRIPKLPVAPANDSSLLAVDTAGGSTVELETILQEMKQGVPPPLSAIETPRVEDSRCFFSPDTISDDPGQNNNQSSAIPSHGKNWGRGRPSNGSRRHEKITPLQDDLVISESEDEGVLSRKKMSYRLSEYRSPSSSRGFLYGSVDNHSSQTQSSQHYPLSRHVGGVPRSPPGTPPESPPASPVGSSPGSIPSSPLQSLQGSPIHSPPGSPTASITGPRSPPPPIHGSPVHSPLDELGQASPACRSPSVASNQGSSDSSNNSSSASSDAETSDEEHKDSDDFQDDLKDRNKEKEFESNLVDERAGDVDYPLLNSTDESAAKNNWSLRNFMERKNSPAFTALATPGRSGLGFRQDRMGSDNTLPSDGKSEKQSLHLGHGGRYSLADNDSVNEILNPTPDIKEFFRSPTPELFELDSMRPNQHATNLQGDLMSPINSPETPNPSMHQQESLHIQSSNLDTKRHSSTYYNPAASTIRSSVSPCGKRNAVEENSARTTVRARTANKTSKHKSRRELHKRRNSSELSEGELDSDSDKKSVSPKRSSSASSSCMSVEVKRPEVQLSATTVTVTTSRNNDSSSESRKPRQITGKKEVKKMSKGGNSATSSRPESKKNLSSGSLSSLRRSVSPDERTPKTSRTTKSGKKDQEKEKKLIVKEEPRKPSKMPGRPPGSGKVASKTVATKKMAGDETNKTRKGGRMYVSQEFIESSTSGSSASSGSEDESHHSNSDEEDEEAGEVVDIVGRSPRMKPIATVAPLPPFAPPTSKKPRMDSPIGSLKPSTVKPLPVKAVVAPITKHEISVVGKDLCIPIKRLPPGRPPGKSKPGKEKIERALVARKKMTVECEDEKEQSEALSIPDSDQVEYKENILPDRLMVRISLSLLQRVPPYPPIPHGLVENTQPDDRMDYEKSIHPSDSVSKGRDLSRERPNLKGNVENAKRDSSRESVVRAKEVKAQDSVVAKKKSLNSVEAASRPSKCRTPPPVKRKLKEEEKIAVPYAKKPKKLKLEKIEVTQSERSNMGVDDEMRYANATPKLERSDSVSSLASFTSQQSHQGSQRAVTPVRSKKSSKKENSSKEAKKEVSVELSTKTVSASSRAGAITPIESKKSSVPFKTELASSVASVVSEKEARKKEKEEKRKHHYRSKEKADCGAANSSGRSSDGVGQLGQLTNNESELVEKEKSKRRVKGSPKNEPADSFYSNNAKVTKESSRGDKSCDKGPNDNASAQYRLDYEPKDERSSDYYLGEAKRLKHQADKESNRTLQVMKYLEAVLYFILTGNAMEETHVDKDKVYTMYKETLHLIKSISSKFQKNQSSSTGSTDNKLAVLSLRCQSRLFLKLYVIRKLEVKDLQRKITEFQKSQAGKLATQLSLAVGTSVSNQILTTGHHLKSPCQPARGLSGGANGVPSPHSPTPSPAGSVASVGSQSSGYSSSELTGNQGRHSLSNTGLSSGHPHPPSSIAPPGNHQSTSGSSVSIPAVIYGMMQRQQNHFSNLQQCHDLWEQGDYLISFCNAKDFFDALDEDCGKLTLHSTISQLVHYIHQGLKCLKDSDT